VDPRFPDLFAEHAHACARRYPWVQDWTPINEPLTTARFSGLYGLWYPHGTDSRTYAAALIGQCRAIVLAMTRIRSEIPAARLVQTEDLGKTWSTPELGYQAEWENHRRWLSLDLLCGRVDARHPLWPYLADAGVSAEDLAWFQDHPCPPDLVGINHYLTSERYLDHRMDRFPADTHGGNGRDRYADVEAVRACAVAGPASLLREAWDRYGLPLAVTEAHLHCTREEQVRWLLEIWDAAVRLRTEGVDLRAVTAWAAFGAFDWNSLLTRGDGHYEPGVFDLRAPGPRPTAIAHAISDLAQGRRPNHPLLAVPGWWRREVRLLYDVGAPLSHESAPADARPLLITGRTGTLGRAFARTCELRGIPYVLTSRQDLDTADDAAIAAALERHRPWAVVNTAGFVRVADAERDPDQCWRDNFLGPTRIARICARAGIANVEFSSDLVFDGERSSPYREGDSPAPLSTYGRTKGQAERHILRANPAALVVRTAAFFSPWDPHNFVALALASLRKQRRFDAFADVRVSPTYVPDLVNAVLDLLIDEESGLWHITNDGSVTWLDFAREAARITDIGSRDLAPATAPAYIPRYSALTSARGILLPHWSDALHRFCQESAPTAAIPWEAASQRLTVVSARRAAMRSV
jgi:dTDP-4-dehydrorhamnose reductase